MNWTDFVIKAFLKLIQLVLGVVLTVAGLGNFFSGQGQQLTITPGNIMYFLSLCVGMGLIFTLFENKRTR